LGANFDLNGSVSLPQDEEPAFDIAGNINLDLKTSGASFLHGKINFRTLRLPALWF